MLYLDQVASSEAEALEIASKKMRIDASDLAVRSVTEIPGGVKVRIEATRSRGDEALELLEEILRRFRIDVDLFYIESFDKILINVKGPNLGLIIGKAGSTLEALETIVSAMHNSDFSMYKPVVINPGGYRDNKKKALQTLVKRAVEEAGDGEKVSLPAMRQRDRKAVHQIIKDFPGFRSKSVGEGKDRRVYVYQAGEDDTESELDGEESEFLPPKDTMHTGVDTDSRSMSL